MCVSDRSSPRAAILIIEDDDATATDLQIGLRGAGYAVRRAASANEAFVSLKSTHADLILMSLLLPDADGLILCSTLKARFTAPVIVLSARPREVDRALALESGALEMLGLPIDVDDLLTIVNSQLPAASFQRSKATQLSS